MRNENMKRLFCAILLLFFITVDAQAGKVSKKASCSMKIQEVLQFFLNESRLNLYFHEDKLPERSPLIIVGGDLFNHDLSLQKFGKPALIKSERPQGASPYLEVACTQVSEGVYRVNYAYPVEGVRGVADIRFGNEKLQLVKEEFFER